MYLNKNKQVLLNKQNLKQYLDSEVRIFYKGLIEKMKSEEMEIFLAGSYMRDIHRMHSEKFTGTKREVADT